MLTDNEVQELVKELVNGGEISIPKTDIHQIIDAIGYDSFEITRATKEDVYMSLFN